MTNIIIKSNIKQIDTKIILRYKKITANFYFVLLQLNIIERF